MSRQIILIMHTQPTLQLRIIYQIISSHITSPLTPPMEIHRQIISPHKIMPPNRLPNLSTHLLNLIFPAQITHPWRQKWINF